MPNWTTWQTDAAGWDAQLLRFPDYTIFQSHAWGEHRRGFGWQPWRLVASDGGDVVAMAQVLVRQLPLGVRLAWVPGGPVGALGAWGDSFRSVVAETTRARQLYCRLSPMREAVPEEGDEMARSGWHQPSTRMNSGISLAYFPSQSDSVRLAQASRNWRHNLRRALKGRHSARQWSHPAPDEIRAAYEAMEEHKGLKEQVSLAALTSALEVLGQRCIVVRCTDETGRLLALRGAVVFGSKGWDFLAAATPDGRKVYASHAAFWELMRQCAAHGIEWYDLSGVDPLGNKGVYDFKKGTGARELRYLGEWDWASSGILRRAANYAIRRLGRITHAG